MNRKSKTRKTQAKPKDLQQERYRLLFDDNPLPMWLFDPETLRFLDVNNAALEKYGYSRQEFLQMTIADIRPPEDLVLMKETVKTRQGLQATGEFRHRLKDGRIINVELTTHVLDLEGKKSILVVANDISARKEAEQALGKSLERYYSALDNLLEGCQIIDFDWRYIYMNDAGAQQGHYEAKELLMHTMMGMYPGIENTELFAVLQRCMEERSSQRMENQFVYPDGTTGWFELSIEPVPEGLFILSIDITERKQADDNIRKQLARLAALREIDLAISSSMNLEVILSIILGKVTHQLGVDATDVLMLDPIAQVLEYAAGFGFRSPIENQKARLKLGQGMAGKIALERKPLYVPNLSGYRDPFVRKPLALMEAFVSYFGVPLIVKGKVTGVLEVFHRSALDPDPDWLSFLEVLGGQTAIAIDNSSLFNSLQRSNMDLVLAYDTTIEGWSAALDLRDKETEGHTQRVTEITLKLAEAMGFSPEQLIQVRRGALLHDIGKMGVPDNILLKPGALTDEEWEIMRKHPTYAFQLLQPIDYLHAALDIPYCHHEKWNGTGYPRGLKGEEIPLAARLFAVVDVWDALRSDRPYREGWKDEKVIEYIRSLAGMHFDPAVVEVFLKIQGKD